MNRQIILVALVPLVCGFAEGLCAPEDVDPPVYTFDLYWSVDEASNGTVCETHGLDYWIIDLSGNGSQQQRLDCTGETDHWSWRFFIGREPLYPGRYTVTVTAFDALDRELTSQSGEIDLNNSSSELDLEFSDSDFGSGGCQLASGGANPTGALPLLLLALALAVRRARRGSTSPKKGNDRSGRSLPVPGDRGLSPPASCQRSGKGDLNACASVKAIAGHLVQHLALDQSIHARPDRADAAALALAEDDGDDEDDKDNRATSTWEDEEIPY